MYEWIVKADAGLGVQIVSHESTRHARRVYMNRMYGNTRSTKGRAVLILHVYNGHLASNELLEFLGLRSRVERTEAHFHISKIHFVKARRSVIESASAMMLPAPDLPGSPPGSAMVLGSQPPQPSQPSQSCNFEGPTLGPPLTEVEIIRLHIEVQLSGSSSAAASDVSVSFSRLLESNGVLYCDGPVPFDCDSFLSANVTSISVCDVDEEAAGSRLGTRIFVWELEPLLQCAPLLTLPRV